MIHTIPMFLGIKTQTDNKEFADYIAALCDQEDTPEAKAERIKLSTEFDDKFPGLRLATVAALKEVIRLDPKAQAQPTLIEFINGRCRATNAIGTSEWHPTVP
jgi:hypothetical protein